jgi:PhnB protein
MAKRSLSDQLDDAVSAVLAKPFGVVAISARELADLVLIAADLKGFPREGFRAELKEELVGSTRAEGKTITAPESDVPTIIPYVMVRRAAALVDFVKTAFDAVETFRTIGSAGGLHAEVRIGDSRLMLGGIDEPSFEERPNALHVYLPDADAVYERALAAGATTTNPPTDQPYGDREACIEDPFGNQWYIATHREGGPVPAGLRTVTPVLHPVGAGRLIDFLTRAFGAKELSRYESPDGVIRHATVRIGDSVLEMGEAHGKFGPLPAAFHVSVEDVDAEYARAVGAGAEPLSPPADQPYGARTAGVRDEFGNTWYLAAPLKDVAG